MLENFTQLFQETLSQDELSLTEKLEEKNSGNSSERHLLEYEEQNNEIITKVMLDLSFTLVVNSTTTWLIFNQLKFITPDFSGIFFHLFIVAVAILMNLPYLTEKTVNRKYLFFLTTGRLLLSFTVNAKILKEIDNKVTSSKQAYQELKTEVRNYEIKQEKPDLSFWQRTDLVLPIVGGFLLIWVINNLFNKKTEVSSNEII